MTSKLMCWLAFGLLVASSAACKEQNSNWCPTPTTTHNCKDVDGSMSCGSDGDCASPTPACDVNGSKLCVQCVAPEDTSACTGATPACGSDNMCRACQAHSECGGSHACLADGTCADESTVAYVDPAGTDNTMCTKAMPCTSVAKALATMRPYVKFTGTTDEAVTVTGGRHVTFLADPGAALTRTTGSGAILTVIDDGTMLTVYDLAIKNAPNTASGYGLVIPTASGAPTVSIVRGTIENNPAGGVSASGGTLTISQSTISGNAGGGISLSSTAFDLQNNFIVQNGGPTSLVGGVNLATVAASGSHRIDFNTITANAGTSSVNSGISCGTIGGPIVLSSNIIYGNAVSGGGKQIGGSANCSTTYSDIGPDATAGTGNVNMDPAFINVTQHDFHITGNSPCKDAADPAAMLAVDFDGDTRPQGSGRDIGADEYKP